MNSSGINPALCSSITVPSAWPPGLIFKRCALAIAPAKLFVVLVLPTTVTMFTPRNCWAFGIDRDQCSLYTKSRPLFDNS